MRPGGGPLWRTVCAFAVFSLTPIGPASAAAVLRSAQVRIIASRPASCEVSMTLAVDGAASVEHRIETVDGTTIDQLRVQGAVQTGEVRTIGRTRSLIVTPSPSAYTISYQVQQPRDRASRCPLWLPTTPADGVSRAVTLQVELPPGMTPGSTMPRFVWTGSSGVVTLAHLPAFVLLPFAPAAEQPGWDVAAAMDVAAVVAFVSASAIWVWRRRSGGSGGSSGSSR